MPPRPAALARLLPTPRRSFITLPPPPPQTILATRVLPFPHLPLYDLISDVDSYAAFVPYCSRSRVTRWSAPDAHGRAAPALADLHIGWGAFHEKFTSALRCVPGVSVEARSGADLHSHSHSHSPSHSGVLRSLETRWSLTPLPERPAPATEVRLSVKVQFGNPLYAAVSAAVFDQMASVMIQAFESRAHKMLSPRS